MHKKCATYVLLVTLCSLFLPAATFAANPTTPILSGDNIQDPGALTTAWGGCGPTDSNCYITNAGGSASFTTLTSSGNTTIGTGASTTNTFGTGAGASNTIGSTTGTNVINGPTTFNQTVTFTVAPILPLTNNMLWIGNGSSIATAVAISGDITTTNTGAFTIANNAVTSGKILDGTLTNADVSGTAAIAYSKLNLANSIVSADIVDGTIATGDLVDSAVTTAKIGDSNVTLAKLATDSVSSAKIVDGSVTNADLANASFTTSLGTAGTDVNVSGSPTSLGGTLTLNVPDASATARGVVTTGAQTFAGAKTFSSNPTLSAMTQGSVPFIGASGLISQNNSQLFWDNTNNRLGLGTVAPSSLLNMSSVSGSALTMSNTAGAGYDTSIASAYNSSEPFSVTSAGIKHYKFNRNDSSVTIGNGATNPILRVESSVGTTPALLFSGAGGIDTVGLRAGIGSTSNLRIYTNALERVQVDSLGNVGIGITPTTKLDVYSGGLNQVRFSAENNGNIVYHTGAGVSNYNQYRFRSSLGTTATPTALSGGYDIGYTLYQGFGTTAFQNTAGIRVRNPSAITDTSSPGDMHFETTATGTTTLMPRMTIKDSGNVGIGDQTPSNKLEITHGTAGNSGLRFTNLLSSNNSVGTANKVLSINGTGDVGLYTVPGTENIVEFSVNANPNTGGTTFSPNQQSDSDVIYASTIDNSNWKWNGSAYVTYIPVTSNWAYNGNTVTSLRSLGTKDSFALPFITNNIERMRVTETGNVGIGTAAPLFRLGNTSNAILDRGPGLGTGTNVLGLGWSVGSGAGYMAAFENTNTTATSNGLTIRTAATDTGTTVLSVGSGTTQHLVVRADGNVGVGTTVPGQKLHVRDGSLLIDNTAGTNYLYAGQNGANINIITSGTGQRLDLGTGFAPAITVATSTNVGVGNISPSNKFTVGGTSGQTNALVSARFSSAAEQNAIEWGHSNTAGYLSTLGQWAGGGQPFVALNAEGGTSSNTFRTRGIIGRIATTDNAGAYILGRAASANADNQGLTSDLTLSSTGALRLHAYGAGALTTDASGNVTASSDERLKNIDSDFSRGMSALQNINPINYHWNEASDMDQANSYTGFSAQNVQASIPEAVSVDPRGYLTLADRPILAAVVNALKEVWKKIAGHDAEIEMLKARIEALEVIVNRSTQLTSPLPLTSEVSITSPTITLHGEQEQTVTIGTSWSDLGATATNNIGEVLVSVNGSGAVTAGNANIDTSIVAEVTLVYTATNAAGATATATRIVHIVPQEVVPAAGGVPPPADTSTEGALLGE